VADDQKTFGSLFALDPDKLSKQANTALRGSDAMRALVGFAGGARADAVGSSAIRNVSAILHDMLDTSLASAVAGAWNTSRELMRYADPREYPPEQAVTCTLSKHTIDVTHQPCVELLYDGQKVGSLLFDLKLELEVGSAVLSIRNGRIYEAVLASCTVSGELSYRTATLIKKTSETFEPPPIRFSDGIPLRSREAVPAGD
jgi:hypothetical protein